MNCYEKVNEAKNRRLAHSLQIKINNNLFNFINFNYSEV